MTTHLSIPAKFWQFNLGHLLIIVGMAGSFILFLNRYENRISQVESANLSTNNAVQRLALQVERMDQSGTNASQRGLLKDTEGIQSNTRRIEMLERMASEIGPRVERTNANVEWMMGYLRDGEDGKGGIYRKIPRPNP